MITEDRLKEILTDFFDERARVDAETHGEHHAWIQAQIDAEIERRQAALDRREMYREIRKTVISWSIPVLLSGVLYFLTHGSWPK